MWRFVNDLRISVKLFLTSLIFILIFLALTVTAYFGLSRQKDITEELFHNRYKVMQQNAKIESALAQAHGVLARVLRRTEALTDAQRSSLLAAQTLALGSAIRSSQELLNAGQFPADEQKDFHAALDEAKKYQLLLDAAGSVMKADARSQQLFLETADARFVTSMRLLQSRQEAEERLTRETHERSLETYRSVLNKIIALFVAAVIITILINIFIVRRAIVEPIMSIEDAARKVARGDLSFDVVTTGRDEIGLAGELLKEAFAALESVLQRIKELSDRILTVVEEVEGTAQKVLTAAESETEATSVISSALLEMNSTVDEISSNTDGLVQSSEAASSSVEQMVSSIKNINANIQGLNGLVASTTVSIDQLSNAIKAVAANSEELEGASDETSAAIAQIASTVREVESHARESANLSERVTKEAATLGLDAIMRTIDGMKEISSSVSAAAASIQSLGNRSKEIEMIVHVIDSVNDETNLLSLNAAILAEQAGEHGKGFAVVAKKIRDLSDKTERSTKEIATLIKTVQREMEQAGNMIQRGVPAVEDGTKLAQAGEAALRKILDSSRRAAEMTLSIQRTTEDQVRSVTLVEESVQRVKQMIGHIAKATAGQSKEVTLIARSADSMKELAGHLNRATGEQEKSSGHIAETTRVFSERSHQIARSLQEHRKGTRSILNSIEAVKHIPLENQDLAFRISKTLWNLQKDVELLGAEMERFKFHGSVEHSLRFGVVPLKEPSEMFRKFKPLSGFLAGKMGRKVDLKVAIDMESAVKDLGENVTQICAMGPANYIEANRKYGVTVIAKALRKGKPSHQVAIVVREGSTVRSMHDLHGKRFAFGNVGSATGHIIPLSMLKEAGMTAADLGHYDFIGHHDLLLKALFDGNFDAAGMNEETVQRHLSEGLRIIALSVEIPEFNICCNTTVDRETRQRLGKVLTALDIKHEGEGQILQSLGKDCTGFADASDEDYARFRDTILGVADEAAAQVLSRPVQKGWR